MDIYKYIEMEVNLIMGLKDVAKLFSNDGGTQQNIVDLLMIMGDRKMTFEEIIDELDFKERYLRFLISKLKPFRLLMGEHIGDEYYYYLSYEGFSTFIKSKFGDAIYGLTRRPQRRRRMRAIH